MRATLCAPAATGAPKTCTIMSLGSAAKVCIPGREAWLVKLASRWSIDNVLAGHIGQRNARMGGDQHVTLAASERCVEQIHDLPLPVVVKMDLWLIEQNQRFCRPEQCEQAQTAQKALLAVAQPLQEMQWGTVAQPPLPRGLGRSRKRLTCWSTGGSPAMAVAMRASVLKSWSPLRKLFEYAPGQVVLLACEIKYQQIISPQAQGACGMLRQEPHGLPVSDAGDLLGHTELEREATKGADPGLLNDHTQSPLFWLRCFGHVGEQPAQGHEGQLPRPHEEKTACSEGIAVLPEVLDGWSPWEFPQCLLDG